MAQGVFEVGHIDRHQANGKVVNAYSTSYSGTSSTPLVPNVRISPEYMPDGRRSLCGISIHAFGLGLILGICTCITAQLLLNEHYLWRISFFMSALALFHYLEFDMTARYNTPDAKVSSFLLFSNGKAYNIAHTAAVLEVLLRWSLVESEFVTWRILTPTQIKVAALVGLILVVLGQTFRSLAMKQAGTSFNHVVQSARKDDHILITSGVYSISRHPAYFGFFWWAVGTQLVLGNYFSTLAYIGVLWKFFSTRIMHEERHLVAFFGADYQDYQKSTPVNIPFIR